MMAQFAYLPCMPALAPLLGQYFSVAPAAPASTLSHTSVTSIVFPRNSDTLLFVAAVLGCSIVPIRRLRICTPSVVYPRTSVALPRVADHRGNTTMLLPSCADTAPSVSDDRGYASHV